MPESRDRLTRPENVTPMRDPRPVSLSEGIGILPDGLEQETGSGTPFRWRNTAMTGTRRSTGLAILRTSGGVFGRRNFGTPRIGREGRGLNLYRSPAVVARQNMTPATSASRGRGRSSNNVLPAWYPRTPLRDITTIVRAIERRRARLRSDGLEIESPIFQDQADQDFSVSVSGAPLGHNVPLTSPNSNIGISTCTPSVSKVPKKLLEINDTNCGELEFLTPQKKLLNTIDTVEKVVMEELRKLKRTPSAKKAEKEKRVKILMSMR